MRVLLVDDHLDFRAAARELLEARGHAVSESADRGEALAAVATFTPDAALVDVRLGGDTGIDVARALLGASPGLAVVLMSADTMSLPSGVPSDCGARGFILKRSLVTTDLSRLFRGS